MTCTFHYIFIQSCTWVPRKRGATSTKTLQLSLKTWNFHWNCLGPSKLTAIAQIFLNFDFKCGGKGRNIWGPSTGPIATSIAIKVHKHYAKVNLLLRCVASCAVRWKSSNEFVFWVNFVRSYKSWLCLINFCLCNMFSCNEKFEICFVCNHLRWLEKISD